MWEGFELSGENHRQLYAPGGYAHGFQCLSDDCRVFYQMSESYVPDLARGICWDDPQIGIRWPIIGALLSPRDQSLPPLAALSV